MSLFSEAECDFINLAVCIKGQADRLGIEHDGVPLEGVVVRIAERTHPAPTEDVREALARALYSSDPLPLYYVEGDEERIVDLKWDWLTESHREHVRSQSDAIQARFHVTPKEEQ